MRIRRYAIVMAASALFGITISSCVKEDDQLGGQKIVDKNKDAVRNVYEQVINTGDTSLAGLYIAMNIVDHNAAPTNAPGIESFKKRIKAFHAAFPDLRYTIENLIAEGDQVVAHVTITGTHKGEFMGMAPSKKVFTINAIDIVRVVNGMWVEYRGTIDNLAMMQQLGLIAMPSDKKKSTGKKSIT